MAVDGGQPFELTDLLVTYVRGAYDAGSGIATEAEGFFLQASPSGPAIFVEATNSGMRPGDMVSLQVLAAGRRPNAPRAVTAFTGLTRSSSGNPTSNYERDVSTVNLADLTTLNEWESRLVSVTGTAQGTVLGAGVGYRAIVIATTGVPDGGTASVRFRAPSPVFDELDFTNACTIVLRPGPMWRFNFIPQPMAHASSELSGSTCPPPNLVSALPQSPTAVIANFDRNMAVPSASAFAIDAGPTDGGAPVVVLSVSPLTSRQFLLNTTPMAQQAYQLSCSPSVVDLRNVALATRVASFVGVGVTSTSCSPVVISQVYPGGGNSGATLNVDFVELHNRTSSAVNLSGWSLQYQSVSAPSWASFPLSSTIPPWGFLLVQIGSPGAAGSAVSSDVTWPAMGLGAAAGKVALATTPSTLLNGCPLPNSIIMDLVAWGATSCSEGTPAAVPTSAQSLLRQSSCQDTGSNLVDFTLVTPAPRGLDGGALVLCSACQGGTPDGG